MSGLVDFSLEGRVAIVTEGAGVRVNTISLGGVESGQPASFIARAAGRIPLGRMAQPHDFQGALVYLCADASAFVTGANLVVDGGKTIW